MTWGRKTVGRKKGTPNKVKKPPALMAEAQAGWLTAARLHARSHAPSHGERGAPRHDGEGGRTTRRMRLDWLRISRGPWRAPARFVVPPSQGIPMSAMSSPAAELTAGSRMNVASPAKRGTTAASTGWGFLSRVIVMTVASSGAAKNLTRSPRRRAQVADPVLLGQALSRS
jgi:hypothetical protein